MYKLEAKQNRLCDIEALMERATGRYDVDDI